jgi:hypothetical protein
MKKKLAMRVFAILPSILLFTYPGITKECPLLVDKQGAFELMSRTNYAWYKCEFTPAEVNDNLKELTALVNTMRVNPVLAGMKGFDCRVELYTISDCLGVGAYGIPVEISFGIASWFMCANGKPSRILMEPPSWKIFINKLRPSISGSIDARTPLEDRAYFSVPGKKETIRPGIDVYDNEFYVMYNPDRPRYWLPVTVREAYTKLVEQTKKDPDLTSRDFMMKFIEKEWAAFSEADRDKPAYEAGKVATMPRILGKVSADATGLPLMRANPEYWDRKLPRSAIQFIFCSIINNKVYIKKVKEEYLKGNSTSYNLYRFLETLDNNTAISLQRHVRR